MKEEQNEFRGSNFRFWDSLSENEKAEQIMKSKSRIDDPKKCFGVTL